VPPIASKRRAWHGVKAGYKLPPLSSGFLGESREPQIPPLRYAPVGMTKGRVVASDRIRHWLRELQIPPLRYASVGMTKGRVVASDRIRPWLRKPQVPPLRYAPVGMTKGRVVASHHIRRWLKVLQSLHYATLRSG
jgi:hypothetical protein